MKAEKPVGEYCVVVRLYVGESSCKCPQLDSTATLEPRCLKYSQTLGWNTVGNILKCPECLAK